MRCPHPMRSGDGQRAVQTQAMENFVTRIRAHTAMQFYSPIVKGLPGQSEPLHNWRLQEYADNHRNSDPNDLRADTVTEPSPPAIPKYPPLHEDATPALGRDLGKRPLWRRRSGLSGRTEGEVPESV